MRIVIRESYDKMSKEAAAYIAGRIRAFAPSAGRPFVLGLPTGSSPLGTYRELARMVAEGTLSFRHVHTLNMDEYVGLPEDHPSSYHYFMKHNFFRHIDIQPKNSHILDGNAPDLEAECREYEAKISSLGGIELFFGGIGADGHIAFNEPGSSLGSRTRVKTLAFETLKDNARFFDGDVSRVPRMALTVGVRTILDAREVVIVVSGKHKARALHQAIEGGVSHMWTVSALQMHPRCVLFCDEDATLDLKVRTYKYFKGLEATDAMKRADEPGTLFPANEAARAQAAEGEEEAAAKEKEAGASPAGHKH